MKTHKNNEIRQFDCDECHGTFKTQQHLKSHKKLVHDNIRDYVCAICQLQFPDHSRLRRHINKIHKINETSKPYNCPHCNLQFKEIQHLKKHVTSIHNSEYFYFCSICKTDNKFKFLNDLKEHQHFQHGMQLNRRKYVIAENEQNSFFDEYVLIEEDL